MLHGRPVVPGGAGDAMACQDFGRSAFFLNEFITFTLLINTMNSERLFHEFITFILHIFLLFAYWPIYNA